MDERIFLTNVRTASQAAGINALLLLSGIEGLYTFKDVELNQINHQLLDSLILTIFALRIGDHFHSLAEENLLTNNATMRQAAELELQTLDTNEIAQSANLYLQSFAQLLGGKSVVRRYHEKALEAAALEIESTQQRFGQSGIGTIVLYVCQHHLQETINLSSFFRRAV